MVIVGNKADDEEKREVSKMDAQIFASKLGVPYFEISAKFNIGITQSMDYIF